MDGFQEPQIRRRVNRGNLDHSRGFRAFEHQPGRHATRLQPIRAFRLFLGLHEFSRDHEGLRIVTRLFIGIERPHCQFPQFAVRPPSTATHCPVMNVLDGSHIISMTSTISRADPTRPSGRPFESRS